MVAGPGGAAQKQMAAQLEQRLKMKQAEMKILNTDQKRLESDLGQDIGMTFGGLGSGR